MTKYKDFIPHTKYKYSILKYCNRNTIYRKIFNLLIYIYSNYMVHNRTHFSTSPTDIIRTYL